MTTIRNIVDEMRQGTAYCEYWQRDWSWTKNHIATLWDSLFKGHPIGLFTFWEQETPEGQVHKLIVDGQQRLLSIYTAMENSLPPTMLPNAPAPPLGLHVDVLSGNFRFHTPMMNRRPQWMPVCDIIQDDAAKMEAMEKALRPKRNAEEWRQCVRNIRTIQNIAERHIMVSTIAPEMKLQEVMELFARMQNNGRRVTKDDIETMWMSPKWPAARSTIHDMIAKWQDTPLQKVATKSNIIRVAGIILNGRQQHCGLSRADASPEQIKGAFAQVDDYLSIIGTAMERHLAIRTKNAFRTVAPISILARYLQMHGGAFPTPEDEIKAMAYLLTTTLRGYRGGSSSSSVNQELDALDSEHPWQELRKISDYRHGPSLTEPTRYDYQIKTPSPHHILVEALRMQPTCKDWVTGQALRDLDPDELVEHRLFSQGVLPDPDQYHCLANTVLVSATTAKSIKAHRSPEQYLHKIAAQMPHVLRQQQIPVDQALWVPQNFHKLAAARTAMIADDATDLITAMQQGRQPSF